jgi:hypothetical protein
VQQTAKISTVPSPTGGINAYDNLASMPPKDAIRLNNIIPQPYGCTVRKGYQRRNTGLDGPVESLSQWVSHAGAVKYFGFAGGNFYDITATGVVGAPLITGLLNDFWQGIGMTSGAGPSTLLFNGADDAILYNGAGLQRLTLGDGIVVNTWAGVSPANIIQATVHQRRVWGVQVDSTKGWYLPADTLYGTAQSFDFGPQFKRGGYLVILATWTVDAGGGTNDYLVAVSSNGEAVVYGGIDVTDVTDWHLVGVYFIGQPPRGRRFFCNVAGDLYILTLTGVVSMATVVTSTQVNVSANNTYSQKIAFLLSDLITTLQDLEGWEVNFFPAESLLIINVPTVYSGGNGQVVANHITTAWCTFSGMDARCWNRAGGEPFFGDSDGNVNYGLTGDKDAVLADGTGGTNILSGGQQAYSNFDNATSQKQIGMYRVTFLGARPAGYATLVSYDYAQLNPPGATGTAIPGAFAHWDEALWDVGYWSGGLAVQRDWRSAQGMGTVMSLSMNLSTEAETTWVSTDYTVRYGGPL